jgi:predicted component of type VI protein secretion system
VFRGLAFLILGLAALLSGCSHPNEALAPPPGPPVETLDALQYVFAPQSIKLGVVASRDLNTTEGVPAALSVCFYQLSDLTWFKANMTTAQGLGELLSCPSVGAKGETPPAGLISCERLIFQPGETRDMLVDRLEGTKHVAVVGGYSDLTAVGAAGFMSIPVHENKKWFFANTYELQNLAAWLVLKKQSLAFFPRGEDEATASAAIYADKGPAKKPASKETLAATSPACPAITCPVPSPTASPEPSPTPSSTTGPAPSGEAPNPAPTTAIGQGNAPGPVPSPPTEKAPSPPTGQAPSPPTGKTPSLTPSKVPNLPTRNPLRLPGKGDKAAQVETDGPDDNQTAVAPTAVAKGDAAPDGPGDNQTAVAPGEVTQVAADTHVYPVIGDGSITITPEASLAPPEPQELVVTTKTAKDGASPYAPASKAPAAAAGSDPKGP